MAELFRDPPGGIAFSVQPSAAESGRPIAPPVEVTVLNTAGLPDSAVARVVTITLGDNPGGGILRGTLEVETTNGVARFADLRLDAPGDGYTLRAGVREGIATASAAFTVTQPPAAQLVFTVQPSSSRANRPIAPAVEVTALQGDGDPAPWFTGAVTLALAPNLLGGGATGTLTVDASGGVARFTNVRIDRVGVDYRLTAAFAGAAPGRTSEPFAVTP